MTHGRFKCIQFRKRTLDFSLECIQMLQNDFFKQQYKSFNATVPGQDRIYPNTHLCRFFLLGIYNNNEANHPMYPRNLIYHIYKMYLSLLRSQTLDAISAYMVGELYFHANTQTTRSYIWIVLYWTNQNGIQDGPQNLFM